MQRRDLGHTERTWWMRWTQVVIHWYTHRKLELLKAFICLFVVFSLVIGYSSNVAIDWIPIFKTTCAEKKAMKSYMDMIDTLYHQANIRVFPRNGFLLGVIRHGGLLPNEPKMDLDLGVMFEDIHEDIPGIVAGGQQRVVSDSGIVYTLTLSPKGHADPFSNTPFSAESLYIAGSDGTTFTADCIYPYGPNQKDHHQVFYPFYVDGHNRDGALKEGLRWKADGAQTFVLGPGNEDKPIDQGYDGTGLGTLFEKEWFGELVPMPFYHSHILVPRDFPFVLRSFYGEHYMIPEQRDSQSQSMPLSAKQSEEFIKNGPLPLCQ